MVAPNREIVNKYNFTPSAMSSLNDTNNATTPGQDINMDTNPIEAMFDLDNNLDEVRGHSLNMSIHRPRSPSLSSSEYEEEYHIQVKWESDRMDEDVSINSSSNFSLEYAIQKGQNYQVSKAVDPTLNTRMQGVSTTQPALNQHPAKMCSTYN